MTRLEKLKLYQDEPSIEAKLSGLKEDVARTLELAKKYGATAAEAAGSIGHSLSVSVRLGNLEKVEWAVVKGITVTVYFGNRKGSASSTDRSVSHLSEMVGAACAIAKQTEPDPYAGLAEKTLLAWQYPDLDLYHPWRVAPDQAITLAKECEAVGMEWDSRIRNGEGAHLTSEEGGSVYGNSHGFVGGYPTSRHSLQCVLVAEDKGEMKRDYDYAIARDHEDLPSPQYVGIEAAKRAVLRLGARRIKTVRAPVIFSPECAGSLFGHFFGAIAGTAIYRKSSFLFDHLGKTLFPERLTIREQPHLKKELGSAPFDAEGVVTSEKDWIREGALVDYVLESYTARKLGRQTTGNAGGVFNVRVSTDPLDKAALLKAMGKGLLVTELMGPGVNKVTGDYSRGAVGFWVEDGLIAYPVEEITIAGNLKEMYKNIVWIANDVDTRSNIHTGSVMIEGMILGGII
ncbi:MAG: metalloprotease PmbA [Gammaproteobacteria bacterium]|nr:metalloprotease PmbA [Gammaproteobacteria bacterium]